MRSLLDDFTAVDREQLSGRGIALKDASEQLAILRGGRRRPRLVRPCSPGDGIREIPTAEEDDLARLHDESVAAGRWSKFVPASGAASRMFALAGEEQTATFCEALPRFAFRAELERYWRESGGELAELLASGRHADVLRSLLDTPGLGYAESPKGLLPFHAYARGSRTAVEEHLREAARCLRDRDGGFRVHFTVSAEHRPAFERLRDALVPAVVSELGGCADVSFSAQSSATDTLALDASGTPARDEAGRLLLRPGGHGALLENLQRQDGDLVFVKNIDNVSHESRCGPTEECLRRLGGLAVHLQRQIHGWLKAIEGRCSDVTLDEAEAFARRELPTGGKPGEDAAKIDRRTRLFERFHRPLRVCGMIPNQGDPGGGPFWVESRDGSVRPQIVEAAEVGSEPLALREIYEAGTHFNPTFMVLAVRDHRGVRYDLQRFVDPERFLVADKVDRGQSILALERPGLWNGAMGEWNTVFVRVPAEVFAPVKSVFDLLRPEHQETERT